MGSLKFAYQPIKFQQQLLHIALVFWFYVQFMLPLQLKGAIFLGFSCLIPFLSNVSSGAHVAVQ